MENKQQAQMTAIAAYITVRTGMEFRAKYIMTDGGSNEWNWTVVSNNDERFDYQILTPRDLDRIEADEFGFADMEVQVQEIIERGY